MEVISIVKNIGDFISSKLVPDDEEAKPYLPSLPAEGSIFREGYLLKRARSNGWKWQRRFFILEHNGGVGSHGTLVYKESFKTDVKGRFEINEKTAITKTSDFKNEGYSEVLQINPYENEQDALYLFTSDEHELKSWEEALTACTKRTAGEPYELEEMCTRFYEGMLFKATENADRWMARHFEIHGHELRYFAKSGGSEHGRVDLLGAQIKVRTTDAASAPTRYVFQINAKERKLNLAAPTEIDYLYWLKAIRQNLANSKGELKKSKRVSL